MPTESCLGGQQGPDLASAEHAELFARAVGPWVACLPSLRKRSEAEPITAQVAWRRRRRH